MYCNYLTIFADLCSKELTYWLTSEMDMIITYTYICTSLYEILKLLQTDLFNKELTYWLLTSEWWESGRSSWSGTHGYQTSGTDFQHWNRNKNYQVEISLSFSIYLSIFI